MLRLAAAESDAPAPATEPSEAVVPGADATPVDDLVLSPEALYLAQQVQASSIIILDAGVPQLESVVNELLKSAETDIQQLVETTVAHNAVLAAEPPPPLTALNRQVIRQI